MTTPRWRSIFCGFLWPYHPGHSGGEIRDFHLLRHLLTISDVEFFALHTSLPLGRDDPLASRLEAEHTPVALAAAAPHLLDLAALEPSRRDRIFDRLREAAVPVIGPRYHLDATLQLRCARAVGRRALQRALEEKRPDFLFVSPQVNPLALLLETRALATRLVMASYDVEAVRLHRFAAARRGLARLAMTLEARRAGRFERSNLARYDGVIAVSDLDRSHLVTRYSIEPERVIVLDNGVDPEYVAFAERQPGQRPHVVYVGSLAYWPNEQAAWRLLRRIMPLVRRRHPDARLSIVGQGASPELVRETDGQVTVVTGRVDDVRPFLSQASVGCIPLLAGSGTRYKILEGLSAGLPLVTTPVAAEGLRLRAGQDLVVATRDEEIAGAVVRLLDDPVFAARLARQGRATVEARYAWSTILPRLDGWLETLARLPRRGADARRELPAPAPPRGLAGGGG